MLLLQQVQVPSLGQELRSHMPCGVAKKKEERESSQTKEQNKAFLNLIGELKQEGCVASFALR